MAAVSLSRFGFDVSGPSALERLMRRPRFDASTVGQTDVNTVQGALAAAGVDTSTVLPQGMTWSQVDQAAQSAIHGLGSGQINFATLAPMIGLALTASGIGAPFAALVTGALAALQGFVSWLEPPAPSCSWSVNGVCFSGKQPYGPSDPNWVTFETWMAGPGNQNDLVGTFGSSAFPWWATVGRDLVSALQTMGQTFPGNGLFLVPSTLQTPITIPGGADQGAVAGFVYAACLAWIRDAESQLNGYQASDPYALALSTAAAWNALHAPGDTYTFEPAAGGNTINPGPVLFLASLLNGDVNGKDKPPFTINTGPSVVPAPTVTPPIDPVAGWPAGTSWSVAFPAGAFPDGSTPIVVTGGVSLASSGQGVTSGTYAGGGGTLQIFWYADQSDAENDVNEQTITFTIPGGPTTGGQNPGGGGTSSAPSSGSSGVAVVAVGALVIGAAAWVALGSPSSLGALKSAWDAFSHGRSIGRS